MGLTTPFPRDFVILFEDSPETPWYDAMAAATTSRTLPRHSDDYANRFRLPKLSLPYILLFFSSTGPLFPIVPGTAKSKRQRRESWPDALGPNGRSPATTSVNGTRRQPRRAHEWAGDARDCCRHMGRGESAVARPNRNGEVVEGQACGGSQWMRGCRSVSQIDGTTNITGRSRDDISAFVL